MKRRCICATSLNQRMGPCLGDEGSPVVAHKLGKFIIVGLLARVRAHCATPVELVRITYYWHWIERLVNEKERPHNRTGHPPKNHHTRHPISSN